MMEGWSEPRLTKQWVMLGLPKRLEEGEGCGIHDGYCVLCERKPLCERASTRSVTLMGMGLFWKRELGRK